MNTRRAQFYQALKEWWINAAMENYNWGLPETKESLDAEDSLWESKELFENGEIELMDVRPVFDTWVRTHQKIMREAV